MDSRAVLLTAARRPSRGSRPTSRAASRAVRASVAALGALSLLAAAQVPAQDAGGPWYVGAGAGASRLTPDTDASTLELTGDTAGAFGLWFGRDLTRRFALEASLASLGDAELSDGSTIGYRAVSGGVLAHLLGGRRDDSLSLYARVGLGFVDNESELELERADSTSIWAAAGVDWPFARRWALRGEIASYDGDAQAGFLTLFRRFGAARPPVLIADAPADAPTDGAADGAVARAPVATPVPTPPRAPDAPVAVPAPAPPATTAIVTPDAVSDDADCPAPSADEPVDARGCARFSGVLSGVDFTEATATPTPIATTLLERLGAELDGFPGLVVEIRAHTDASLGEARAQALSRERAVAVARSLAGSGVDVSRLRARAFGATRPRADDASPGGRRLNNRIELRVLP